MPRMVHCEAVSIRYSDRYEAFAQLWLPPRPRGAVLYLHGIQSHGAWFERSAGHLADAGWAVLLPDRRGSGRNEVDRGHTPDVRRWLRDCTECLDDLHVRIGVERFHVVGVSWGGKLALGLCRHAPERVASMSLIAPGLFPRVDLPLLEKVKVGLSAIAARRTRFEIPLSDPTLFTGNPVRRQFIREDPLALRQVTAGFLLASRRLDRYAQGIRHQEAGCPLHVYLAGRDRIIDNARTKAFIRGLRWPQREITEYHDADHTLEFEPDPEPFLRDLTDWLNAHA
jgi:alpha-beta hydrolase superfamily lysophospholipase